MYFLTYPQASVFLTKDLGVPMAEATLRRKVSQKCIPFTKLGKRVVFDRDRLIVWVQAHAVEPKS